METGVMSTNSLNSDYLSDVHLGITQRQEGNKAIKNSRNQKRIYAEKIDSIKVQDVKDLGQDSYNLDIMNKIYFDAEKR